MKENTRVTYTIQIPISFLSDGTVVWIDEENCDDYSSENAAREYMKEVWPQRTRLVQRTVIETILEESS